MEIGAGDSRTCSFFHHTSFARGTQSEFIENANASLAAAAEFFHKCNKVIITLGTSWCYRHIGKDMIVSNCLKRNPKEFIREFLPASRTAAILREIMELCPDKQFIFTVSPIRHFKDGAHGNQISKASLLLGIEEALAATPVDLSMNPHYTADYFPAYEIVMDELRDYRFYADDMIHPSERAVEYIWQRFQDTYFDHKTKDAVAKAAKEWARHQHRKLIL